MIEILDIHKSYGATKVLTGISLDIAEHAMTCLVGPNGAGKSTLLSLIARLDKPDAGTVRIDELDVAHSPTRIVARTVSVLRQQYAITARVTVRDLVGFGRFPHSQGRLGPEDHAHIESALEFFDLHEIEHRFIDELSGGQRQRALAAMVLAQDTDVILLDEPLNNLDMEHSVRMMQRLRTLVDDFGKTIVLVLHDINFASAYADDMIVMHGGHITRRDAPKDLMTRVVVREAFAVDADVIDHDDHRYALYYRSTAMQQEGEERPDELPAETDQPRHRL